MQIETLRCLINPLESADVDAYVLLHTDPQVRRYLGGPADVEAIRQTFAKLLEFRDYLPCWAVRLKGQARMIGLISLGKHHDGPETELSFQFLHEVWHQGYGIETVGAMLEYAIGTLRLRRVVAETQVENQPSRRLLEGIGLRPERELQRFGAEQILYSVSLD